MRIAILGATSQIAKDLIQSFGSHNEHECVLYARRPEAVAQWLAGVGLAQRYAVAAFEAFAKDQPFDAILNFVGVGNPAQAVAMGASIFDVTAEYDEMALRHVRRHPACRYLFLSSGAAYGSGFDAPADVDTKAAVAINHLQPHDWYGAAKLHAECRHRAMVDLPIVDIRVFNYFSRTNDLGARYFITDILLAIRDQTTLHTTPNYMRRDFLGPKDFQQIVSCILAAPEQNLAVDCYTRAPIDKQEILSLMQQHFGLRYQMGLTQADIPSATGAKPHYYSLSRRAADLGYQPTQSSADNLVEEARALLGGLRG